MRRQRESEDTRSNMGILELKEGFSQEELKKAHRSIVQKIHEDKWSGRPKHFLKALEEELKLVNRAYDALKNDYYC